ncbi:MAG: alcohol dehydrogenase catalytic domain-containing protein, partial [Actinomycetes bacterium]
MFISCHIHHRRDHCSRRWLPSGLVLLGQTTFNPDALSRSLTLLQVRVHGPGDVRVDQIADPEPGPADALVRVAACGICGSDLSYIKMGGVAGPGPEPLCL